ncbi:MAG: family transporter protein [Lacunisphaera sp.]|nr:family transporter protein [Lacunisphaera sp.]
MRIILTLLGKDFANLRRNRAALVLTFVVPMVIIYIVGLVFGLGRSDSGPSGIPLAVVNQSDNPAAQKLFAALQAEKSFRVITQYVNPDQTTRPLTENDLRPLIRDRRFSYALVIPADVLSETRLGLHLKILSDPRNDIESQTVNGLLQKTIFSNVPQLLGQSLQSNAKKFIGGPKLGEFNGSVATAVAQAFGGDPDAIKRGMEQGNFGLEDLAAGRAQPGPSQRTGGDILAKLVTIDTEQVVGRDVKSPAATRIVGGYAVMFLLFALSSSSAAFFSEKNSGVFQRVLSAPVSRAQLLWSRFLYGVLFGLIQLVALFFAGQLLYGVDVYGHLGNLLIICASVAAACTGFGMLLSAITRSPEAASSLATLLVIMMSACGGAWFPVSFMPDFMQHIARFTIVYWAIEGFGEVLWAGNSFMQLLPTLGILLGTTAVAMTIAVWRFNRSRVFD